MTMRRRPALGAPTTDGSRCRSQGQSTCRPRCGIGSGPSLRGQREGWPRAGLICSICMMESFEIPGERHSDINPGRSWWWSRLRDLDMEDMPHDGGATMTNLADTTIRAVDNLEIPSSLNAAEFSDAAMFRHHWTETRVSVAGDNCSTAAAAPEPQSQEVWVYCQFCFRTLQRPRQRDGVHCPVPGVSPGHQGFTDFCGGGGHEVRGPPREGVSAVAHPLTLLMQDADPMMLLACEKNGPVVELGAEHRFQSTPAHGGDGAWLAPSSRTVWPGSMSRRATQPSRVGMGVSPASAMHVSGPSHTRGFRHPRHSGGVSVSEWSGAAIYLMFTISYFISCWCVT